jgi:hypothetical protein
MAHQAHRTKSNPPPRYLTESNPHKPSGAYSHTTEELETIALETAKEELLRKLEQLSIKQLAALVMGKNVRIRIQRPPSGTFQRVRQEVQGNPEERRLAALARLKRSGE